MMLLNYKFSLLSISGHIDCYPLFQWIFQIYILCSFLLNKAIAQEKSLFSLSQYHPICPTIPKIDWSSPLEFPAY